MGGSTWPSTVNQGQNCNDRCTSDSGHSFCIADRVRAVLRKEMQTVCSAAPDAQKVISYRMPALRQKAVLTYYAAFKHHIGFYPPIKSDADLEQMPVNLIDSVGAREVLVLSH